MEAFAIEGLTFTYPTQTREALSEVTLHIPQGQFWVIAGYSGSGKSTLLHLLKPALAPAGNRSGEIYFEGRPLQELSLREQAMQIGFVGQHPDNQLVTDKVWHELAFGLENLGEPPALIRRRVSEVAAFFGMQAWFDRAVATLSGGQKQLLNLASVVVMQPKVLLLDEPTAQLDPIAAAELLHMVDKIHRELGTTIIMVEHTLTGLLELADRLVILDAGQVIMDDEPRKASAHLQKNQAPFWLAMPAAAQLYGQLGGSGLCPLTVEEGQRFLEKLANKRPYQMMEREKTLKDNAPVILEADEIWLRYEKDLPDILQGLSLSIRRGMWYALVGGNGSGKSTILLALSGALKPYRGEIVRAEGLQVALLPQDPQLLFSQMSVRQEMQESLGRTQKTPPEQEKALNDMSELCQLQELLDRHPYDLSGGEQQRLALAKILLQEPDVVLLDEPAKGVDALAKAAMGRLLKRLQQDGLTIVMVSHDLDFCAQYADVCGLFFNGQLACEDKAWSFFAGNRFYTTEVNRIARQILPQAVVLDDVLHAFGQEMRPKPMPQAAERLASKGETAKKTVKSNKPRSRRQWLVLLAVVLVMMPLTIWGGIHYLEDRRYNITALLLIAEALLPFFLLFEQRKPKARELVTLAVLCALGVTGRMAFFMVPQFKPVIALIIITAVALGAENGFLVGAMIGFVSNFFFGQGPWTPWQMFAFGLIGLLAGFLAERRVLRKNTLSLCLFGGLATLVIYGGLLNPASVIMFQDYPTKEMFALAYLQGLPFDLVHAASTMFFLWLLAQPMLEKLARLKRKYHLFDQDESAN